MVRLEDIDDKVLSARGAYSTVRAAREDEIRQLQKMTDALMTLAPKILKMGQGNVSEINHAMDAVAGIEACGKSLMTHLIEIESLVMQKDELRPLAWPKE